MEYRRFPDSSGFNYFIGGIDRKNDVRGTIGYGNDSDGVEKCGHISERAGL